MERNLALELVRVTEASALASARYLGKGDGIAADRAACEAMALAIKDLKIDGTVVIGERSPNATLSRENGWGRGATSAWISRSTRSSRSTRWRWEGRTRSPSRR